jgi:hypothetical protein
MSLLETLITKLLADSKITYFEDNMVFRTQVLDQPEAADILLDIMASDTPDNAARAGEMLSLFSWPGALPVLKGLSRQDTEWRTVLMSVLWSMVTNSEDLNRADMLQEGLPHILPLLDDRSLFINPEVEHPVEIEYEEYRICDEAYLLLRYLQAADYDDEDFFKELTYEERDAEIRSLRNRLQPSIV